MGEFGTMKESEFFTHFGLSYLPEYDHNLLEILSIKPENENDSEEETKPEINGNGFGILYSDFEEEETNDLFNDWENLPEEVQAILDKYRDWENDYRVCEELLKELKAVGYTFEYGLDAVPFNLRKLPTEGRAE
jgi:hypothetical protein